MSRAVVSSKAEGAAGQLENALSRLIPMSGDEIDGRYVAGDVVGSGAMGCVLRARDRESNRDVAVKFLSPEMLGVRGMYSRFLREAVASMSIPCEHVVEVFDVGALPSGVPYIVMELLEGRALGELLRDDERDGIAVERATYLCLQIARALQFAHASGVIHRDLKLSNCFVSRRGEAEFVKVLDFGVSKLREASRTVLTTTDMSLGTPAYMAPEQATASSGVDARADIYSLGVIAYKLLTNRFPLGASPRTIAELISLMATGTRIPVRRHRPELPEGLACAIDRAISTDARARFASALQFAEALAPFAGHQGRDFLAGMQRSQASLDVPSVSIQPALLDAVRRKVAVVAPLAPLNRGPFSHDLSGASVTLTCPNVLEAAGAEDNGWLSSGIRPSTRTRAASAASEEAAATWRTPRGLQRTYADSAATPVAVEELARQHHARADDTTLRAACEEPSVRRPAAWHTLLGAVLAAFTISYVLVQLVVR